MSNYPFIIEKLIIEKLSSGKDVEVEDRIVGYFVKSTAPLNVEENYLYRETNNSESDDRAKKNPDIFIKEIANFLSEHQHQKEKAEVIINIHGYNTKLEDVEKLNKEIYEYICKDKFINNKRIVFIGYRWPSENFIGDVKPIYHNAVNGLPVLFRTLWSYSWLGLIFSILTILLIAIPFTSVILLFPEIAKTSFFYFAFLIGCLSVFCLGLVFSVIFLRVSVYFRDNYRATNFGVPDLVELIRQLDNAFVETCPGDTRESKEKHLDSLGLRIKLSFIGHSMGAFVTTGAIRILSDVFDEKSIQPLSKTDTTKQPSADIGHVFSLGRLVLASPDIPIETLMPERTNFLRSSLRRFDESYLFSNQGDIVLRVASTAANYLSFPANTYDRGFRLGNVTVEDSIVKDSNWKQEKYGIVNLQESGVLETSADTAMKHFCIISDNRPKSLTELSRGDDYKDSKENPIAGLFTCFDCTNYKDYPEQKLGFLTKALGKKNLTFYDNFGLIVDYLSGKIDVHGGYFQGEFTKLVLYRLAFIGFQDLLKSLADGNNGDSQALELQLAIQLLHKKCQEKGIEVFLAPERYEVDVLGKERNRQGY
jgi:hypothetical protein